MATTRTEQQEEEQEDEHQGLQQLLSSYLGLSFTLFLATLPQNSLSLITRLQARNKDSNFKLKQAEEHLRQVLSRRKEDSKANARVVEIFASHRHAWQQEERRLMQQIDESGEEIALLRSRVEELEKVEAELKASLEELRREISERDELLNFMSRGACESGTDDYSNGGSCAGVGEFYGYGKVGTVADECFMGNVVDKMGDGGGTGTGTGVYGHNKGFSSDLSRSAGSKFWAENARLWQDVQYEPIEPLYNTKHFVARRESPWKVDSDPTGVSSKLKVLEQELQNLERLGETDLLKVPSQIRKQGKRYEALSAKIEDLCRRMQASDPSNPTLSSEFRTQRQTEFLLEAFRLQQRAAETAQKLTALQNETGRSYLAEEIEDHAKLATKRSFDSIRNNFKDIQRNLEIWLARIIGDLEGILARDGASRVKDYYMSRYPFDQ